jgi:hypothetical protein
MTFAPIQGSLGVQPVGTIVTCVNRSGETLVIGDLVITSFIHDGVVVNPEQAASTSYVFNCIRKASASESGNTGYLGVVTKLLTGGGVNGREVEVQFGGICTAKVLVTATVTPGTLLGVSATAGVLSNTISNSRYSVTLMDNAAVADGTALKRVYIPLQYETNTSGVDNVAVNGLATEGLNYTFNANVNTITPRGASGSNANTISGGGNLAQPNLILNNASDATCAYRTISGGYDQVIGSTNLDDGAIASVIAGGAHHRIRRPTSTGDIPNPPNQGLGSPANLVAPTTDCLSQDPPDHGTIGGGGYNAIRNGNYGTIAGGSSNVIMGEASDGSFFHNAGTGATIAGGEGHWVSGNNATIGGGTTNTARQIYGTIAGGVNNLIRFLSTSLSANNASTIGGGNGNKIYNATIATICGGSNNSIGASSDAAIAYGSGATIGGGLSNSIGTSATYALYSTIIGGQLNTTRRYWSTVLGGLNNTAGETSASQGECSIACGRDAIANHNNSFTQGAGKFSAAGDAQASTVMLTAQTTNATLTTLLPGNSVGGAQAGILLIPTDTAWAFSCLIIGRATASDLNGAYQITGLAKNNGGTVALVGTPTVTTIAEDSGASAWNASVSVSGGNLLIQVTGAASTTIRWVGRFETSEVTA